MHKVILLALTLMLGAAHAQLIDAEAYIKKNGYEKKTVAGNTTFFTAHKKVRAEELRPYIETIKTMPRTEDALTLCKKANAGAAIQLASEGRNDLRVRDAFGYGGPVDNTIACVILYEHKERVERAQVHYWTLSQTSPTKEIYTIIFTY